MDTIAAIATGAGVSAIGVLRVSGPAALAAAEAVFRPRDGRPLSAHAPRTLGGGRRRGREGGRVGGCRGCCGWGSRPSSPRGPGRRGRGSSPARPF